MPKKHRLPIKDLPPKAEVLFRGRNLIIKGAPNGLGVVRIGLSSSKKKIAKAAVRNSVKRYAIDHLVNKLRDIDKKGMDLLIIISTPIIKLDQAAKDILGGDLERASRIITKTNK